MITTESSVGIRSAHRILFGLAIHPFVLLWFLGATTLAMAPVSASANSQETAIRKVVIAPFSTTSEARGSAAEAAVLGKLFAKLLADRSYLQTKALDRAFRLNTPSAVLIREATAAGVDGVILGEVGTGEVAVRVVSASSGRTLMNLQVPLAAGTLDRSSRRAAVEDLTDAFLAQFPYRGFVTESLDDDIEINLGSAHGMRSGLRLQVFEFDGEAPSFESRQRFVSDIEVKEVKGPDRSLAVRVGRGREIQPYSKIAFADRPIGTAEEIRTLSRGWVLLGAEMLTINAEVASDKYSDHAYKMDSTPFLLLSLGIGKFSGSFKFGQARNDVYDLAYAEAVGYWKLGSRIFGPVLLEFNVGGRIANFNVTTKRNVAATLTPSTSVSPAAMGEVAYALSTGLLLYLEGELFYPAFSTSGSSDGLLYTLGGGVSGGLRIDLKSYLALELGARSKYFRKPIEGMSGVQERQTSYYAGLVALF